MAEYKIPYRGVEESLHHLRKQVFDSIPYCVKNIPEFKTPEELFYYLRSRTKYKNDPLGVELFQSVPTLLENNFHNESGAGDCDCFTILCLASLIANGYYNVGIVLVGRSKFNASHIYAYVDTNNGRKILDLTNKVYNYERSYPYKQELPFKISKNQLDMFLQLADKPRGQKRRKALNYDPYLWIGSKNIAVREDQFDKLPLKDFCDQMLSEGYALSEISELAGRRATRVQARKETRKETKAEKPRNIRKQEKHEAKMEKKASKTEARQARSTAKIAKAESKAEARETRARAKETKAEAKRIRAESGEEEPSAKLISKGGRFIGKIVQGKLQPAQEEETDEELSPESYEGEEVETEETESEEAPQEEELSEAGTFNIFGVAVPKPLVYIGAGLLTYSLLTAKPTRR